MKILFRGLLIIMLLPILVSTKKGDDKKTKDWDVSTPYGPHHTVEFETDEGTWMNLDVSPDGKEIIFDLLGDIYTMPIEGGEAKLLRGGLELEVQPRYSPDGKHISFTSDKEGGDNIWVMDRDGSNAHSITKEDFRLCNNAVWTPDGNYLIAKKHFTSGRSLGSGEMWMYHITGGSGLQLTKRKNDQEDVGEPAISPGGRYLYWSEDMSPGPDFQYNKDPNSGIYDIRRLDRESGKIDELISGPGGAVRPQPSHDGKLLAFVRRVRTKSVLFLHDLHTGEEWPIFDKLDRDQQETWATFGVYANYNFTPDDKNIIIWAKGKIWNVNVTTLEAHIIPFKAHVTQTVTDALHFPQQVYTDKFEAKMIRHAITSPDGKQLAFNAAGHIYVKTLPNGEPTRLTKDAQFEYEPSWSPDGKEIVYTTWEDSAKGSIYKIALKGKAKPVKLTSEPGYYHTPSFSNDGKKIVYEKGTGDGVLGYTYGEDPGIYIMDADGKNIERVSEDGVHPRFNKDGTRIYYSGGHSFKSIDIHGDHIKTHFTSEYDQNFAMSPDGKWIAWTELFQAYVAPFPLTGNPVDLSSKTSAFPVYRVSRDAGTCLHWSADSKTLHWVLGPNYFSRDIKDCFTWLPGSADSIMPRDTVGLPLNLTLKADCPEGAIALKGARIITMKGDEVIENGTIIIEKNKIIAIGKASDIAIPAGAKIIDVQGKTIMPGIVDVHAHPGCSGTGISPQYQWSYMANLAYGVTTTHDPSNSTEMVFSQSEMQKEGLMMGPRIYSTGTILYGAEGDFKAVINSLDDARSHLRRLKAVGAFSVKSYNQPRRNQRQQVIAAARELHMEVVPEGGSFLLQNFTHIVDGHTGVEHSLPVSPLYNDYIKLWNGTTCEYTPTLIVGYGGIFGENYWYQKTNVWENTRLLSFTPRGIIDSRSRRRTMAPDDDFSWMENSRSAAVLQKGGTKVHNGAHGQLNGLGAHWEMWMLKMGGMSALEAIRASTIDGAEYIGMDKEIGSLEVGKLADLVIMDKNPLEDIQNSQYISYVMLNGRLYDAATLNEVGNYNKKRHKFYWEYSKSEGAFPWHEETNEED